MSDHTMLSRRRILPGGKWASRITSCALIISALAEMMVLYSPTHVFVQGLSLLAYACTVIALLARLGQATEPTDWLQLLALSRFAPERVKPLPPTVVNKESIGSRMRRYQRIVPLQTATILKVGNKSIPAQIVDVSLSGVALSTSTKLSVEQVVFVGSRKAKVVRLFGGGAGLDFAVQLDEHGFDENVVL